MALREKILIAGFSGVGKTSLLQALKPLAPDDFEYFDDLDRLIMKAHGKGHENLAELIESVGWDKFRLWERQALEGWLKEEGKGVLALGGGTLSPLVWELFGKQRKILFCHLDVDFETIWSRLNLHTDEPRPLLSLGKIKMRELFEDRLKIYSQISWKLDGSRPLQDLAREFFSSLK